MESQIPVTSNDIAMLNPSDRRLKAALMTDEEVQKLRANGVRLRVAQAMLNGGGSESLIASEDQGLVPEDMQEQILMRDPMNAVTGLRKVLKQFDASEQTQVEFLSLPDAQLYIKRIEAIFRLLESDEDLKEAVLNTASSSIYQGFYDEMRRWIEEKRYGNNELHGIKKIVGMFYARCICSNSQKVMPKLIASYTALEVEETMSQE